MSDLSGLSQDTILSAGTCSPRPPRQQQECSVLTEALLLHGGLDRNAVQITLLSPHF